jgi:hypothetical protein
VNRRVPRLRVRKRTTTLSRQLRGVRENEDVVLDGTPALVLRRVSVANWTAAPVRHRRHEQRGVVLVGDGKPSNTSS